MYVSRLVDNSKVVKCICRKTAAAERWTVGRDDDLGVKCSGMYRRICRLCCKLVCSYLHCAIIDDDDGGGGGGGGGGDDDDDNNNNNNNNNEALHVLKIVTIK